MIRLVVPDVEAPRLLDTAEVVSRLRVATPHAAVVEALVASATARAERIAGRYLVHREVEELVRHDGDELLELTVLPVVELLAAEHEDSGDVVDVGDFDIWPDEGLRFASGCYGPCQGMWRLRYVGGYWPPSAGDPPDGALPVALNAPDIATAVYDIVRQTWAALRRDPAQTWRAAGNTSVNFDNKLVVPPGVRETLRQGAAIVP